MSDRRVDKPGPKPRLYGWQPWSQSLQTDFGGVANHSGQCGGERGFTSGLSMLQSESSPVLDEILGFAVRAPAPPPPPAPQPQEPQRDPGDALGDWEVRRLAP